MSIANDDDPRLPCEDCGAPIPEGEEVKTPDGMVAMCQVCGERFRIEDARRGPVEASRLAVEAALGAGNLLNGGGAHPDDEDEDEDETVEIEAPTLDELHAERHTRPAPLTDVHAYEHGRRLREAELARDEDEHSGRAA